MKEIFKRNDDVFIGRAKEFDALSQALDHSRNVIIEGIAGIGKTALVYHYLSRDSQKFSTIISFDGYEIEIDPSKLDPFLIPIKQPLKTLIFIDGIDNITSVEAKKKLLRIFKEGRKFGVVALVTSRILMLEKGFSQNSITIKLEGLNSVEAQELLKSYDQTPDKDPQDPRNMLHLFDEFRGNPRAIGMAFNMLKYDSAESLLATINNPLDYKNEFIRDYLSKQQIVLPSAPKIIQDVRFINSRIVDRINRDPSSMYDLSPRDFEILVKELFEERGHKVELTGQTRDGGKDLIIVNTSELGNLLIYGECKRYSPDHPVGVSVVSDLVGRVMTDRATAGIVITSSYFSPDAKVLSEKIPHQMSLIDYKKLSDWLTKVE